jgi:hypothetical protein
MYASSLIVLAITYRWQARWFLSAEDDWRLDDGLFSKQEFFNRVIELFEQDPDDEWCVETLEWWNK